MNQTKPQTLKGFRDFLPSSMAVRNYVKKICVEVFEKYGFQPLETPTLEYASTLMGKYGEEADKLVYTFQDKGDRLVGLRYDLTVPTAKVLSIYQNELPLPFKRYQIQPVWRADKPQKGRYREFYQCDIDTFGSASPLSDAELIAVIYEILTKLNFKKFSIRINSRQVLYDILAKCGIENDQNSVLQSLDKYGKIGEDGVKEELTSKGLPAPQINAIFEYIKTAQPDDYLTQMFSLVNDLGVPQNAYAFDPTLVRGLDYYTGAIFETYVEEPKIGSVTGGGRYDNLVKSLGGPDIPAVGTTVGLDRIVDVIEELNLLPDITSQNLSKVMMVNFGADTQKEILSFASELRNTGINVSVYPQADKLGKQFKYADSIKIPYVVIIGSDEVASGTVVIKNMTDGSQQKLPTKEALDFLRSLISVRNSL